MQHRQPLSRSFGSVKTATRNIIEVLTLTSVSVFVSAAQAVTENLTDAFDELPIVLSSNTLEQNTTESPLTISIIDKQMIEATGARTIPDALRLVPGIVVGHSVNDFGDKPLLVVAYHGHSDQYSRQMNVLIDGRTIYDPLLGGVNWYNIPITVDDIERIEVTHGPNASTYGSNSFQAVINIITRRASEDQDHFVKINAGNRGIFDATYRYGGSSDDVDYRVTVSKVKDDGQERAGGGDVFDDVSAGVIDYRIDYQLDQKNQITYQGSYGDTRQNTEATLRPTAIPKLPRRVIDDISAHQFIRWDSTIDSKQSFVVKYYYNYLQQKDASQASPIDLSTLNPALAGTDPLVLSIDQSYVSTRNNLDFTHFINPDDDTQLSWGASIQNDHIDSAYYLFPSGHKDRNTYRLFGNGVFDIDDNHIIDLGLLVESSEGAETNLSPRFAYLYRFNNRHTLRAGISKAVRTPFIIEQFGQIFISEDITVGGIPTGSTIDNYFLVPENRLRSEKITSIEIGYRGKFLQNDLAVGVRLFQDKLKDLVDAPTSPTTATPDFNGTAFIFDNLNSSMVRGIETEFDYSADSSTRLYTSISLLKIFTQGAQTAQLEESAPDLSISVLASHEFNEKYTGSTGIYYVGDFAWTDVSNFNVQGDRNTGGYTKLDLRLVRNFHVGSDRLTAAFVVQNALGEYSDYDAIPNTPQPVVVQSLTAFIELKMKFR